MASVVAEGQETLSFKVILERFKEIVVLAVILIEAAEAEMLPLLSVVLQTIWYTPAAGTVRIDGTSTGFPADQKRCRAGLPLCRLRRWALPRAEWREVVRFPHYRPG